MIAKHRSRGYLAQYVRNPQAINRTSIMPKYDLPEADLNALADFILSLDFSKYPAKTITPPDKSVAAKAPARPTRWLPLVQPSVHRRGRPCGRVRTQPRSRCQRER